MSNSGDVDWNSKYIYVSDFAGKEDSLVKFFFLISRATLGLGTGHQMMGTLSTPVRESMNIIPEFSTYFIRCFESCMNLHR